MRNGAILSEFAKTAGWHFLYIYCLWAKIFTFNDEYVRSAFYFQ